MNGQSLLQCISETTDFRFPLQVRNGITSNRGIIIYEILQQIFSLLNEDYPNDIWNTTCIENLQNRLYQEINEIETCCDTTENGLMTCDYVTSYPWTLKVKRFLNELKG
ncbi:Interferon omega-1 [Varanus komodoensis]|nr:Interferon omega-1 [Varanus komodoensis]